MRKFNWVRKLLGAVLAAAMVFWLAPLDGLLPDRVSGGDPKALAAETLFSTTPMIVASGYHLAGLNSNGTVVSTVLAEWSFYEQDQSRIDSWRDIVFIAAGEHHFLGVRSDGTVEAAGWNNDGQCDVSSWEDIIAADGGTYCSVGLKRDGTLVTAGSNTSGMLNVSSWINIVAISVDGAHTVGLKDDGTVIAVGNNNSGQCNVSAWTDIIAISAGSAHTVGLKRDGTVISCGRTNEGQRNVSSWRDISAISAGSNRTIGLKTDGTVVTVGSHPGTEYEDSDTVNREVANWTDIIRIATGGAHAIGLRRDGTVVGAGTHISNCSYIDSWTGIIEVQAAGNHTLGLDKNGCVYLTGNSDFGSATVSNWFEIVAISSNYTHTLGLESDGTVLSAGEDSWGYKPFDGIEKWEDIIAISVGSWAAGDKGIYCMGLKNDGTVVSTGSYQQSISTWTDIIAISSSGTYCAAGVKADGTVVTAGAASIDVSSWSDIVSVSVGGSHIIGLKSDGTVVAKGANYYDQLNVEDWSDIIAVSAGFYESLGLKSNGTVVATGQNDNGQLDVSDWTDIVAISTVSDAMTYRHTVGLKSDGSVVATGYRPNYEPLPIANWDLIDEAIGGGSDEDDNIGDSSELTLQLYSNRPSLNLAIGETIQLGVGVFDSGKQISDVSKIVYTIETPSLLRIASSGTRDDYRYASVVALNIGTTHIQISDANTGTAIRVPVTVSEPHGNTFTIYNVPKVNYERDYLTNFYNFNGMYVDSYTHSTNPDGSANISFDVYNTQIMFGAVEVYDEKGRIIDARVIDKMTGAPTSIKETLWDGMGCLIHDFGTGEIFTYKQQSGFSKRSEIEISNVPKGGYIRITNDPFYSTLCSIINGVDLMFEIKSVLSSASDFDGWNAETASEFTKAFTVNMFRDEVMVNLIQGSEKIGEKIVKSIAKDAITDGKSLSNFFTSLGSALAELDVFKIIAKTGLNVGISAVESSLESFMGLAGTALNFIFIGGECLNFQMHFMNYARFALRGYIDIQVPSDNSVSSGGVTAESEDGFSNETALQVYNLYYDTDIADKFFKGNTPEELSELENTLFYEISLIKNGISVQPETPIKISIPIPPELRSFAGFIKIYRIDTDGALTDMNAVVENGLLVFRTDHLSLYALTGISTSDAETDDPTEIEEPGDTEESDDTDDPVETDTPTETEESEDTQPPANTQLPPSYNVPSGSAPSKSSSTTTAPSAPPSEPVAPREPAPELPFADISKSDWFYDDAQFVYARGLFNGTTAATFSPHINMTRAMLVTVLYRLAVGDGVPDVPHADATGFADVPPGQWYSDAIAWAANLGIIAGTGDNKFAPNTEITRQDLAVLLYRYTGSPASTASLSAFTDAEAVSGYARDALAWAISAGIIRGGDDGKIDPKASATRADAAAMLRRFIDAAENSA